MSNNTSTQSAATDAQWLAAMTPEERAQYDAYMANR